MAVLRSGDEPGSGEGSGLPESATLARGRRAATHQQLIRRLLLLCVTPCVLLAASLLSSEPAMALSQRGHVFAFSFGGEGNGAGQFRVPSGVAVNDSTGHLYVADRENNRVEEFEPEPATGAPTTEKFVTSWEVLHPENIAIDNAVGSPSHGDVYVSGTTKKAIKEEEPENKIVFKFGPNGEPIFKLKKFKEEKGAEAEEFEPILGLAVDSSGNVLVYDEEGVVASFNSAVKNKSKFSLESPFTEAATRGVAIDSNGIESNGNLYLGHLSSNKNAEGTEGKPPVIGRCGVEEEEVVVEGKITKVKICEGKEIPELDQQKSTAVAVATANEPNNLVSELNDSYVTNVRTIGGKKVTTVASFDPSGSLLQRFGHAGLSEASGVAVDSLTGNVFVTDAASDQVYAFMLEPSGPPQIDSLTSCSTGPSCTNEPNTTKLSASVNPVGADTHAYFEYGAVGCSVGSCTKSPEVDLHEGFGDVPTSVELQGLQPGTYTYRVVAKNVHGEVSSEKTFSIASIAGVLPDGRAWEMVSPPNKDGAEPEAITQEGGAIQAARDGSAITYVADGPIPANGEPEGNRNPELSQIISVRSSGGWVSQDLATPHAHGVGVEVGITREYQLFSPNLALGLVEPFVGGPHASGSAEPPLSPPLSEGEAQEKTIYLHDNAQREPEASERANWEAAKKTGEEQQKNGRPGALGYLALVTGQNFTQPFGGGGHGPGAAGIELLGGSPDLSRAVFKSWKAAPGLYEWGPNPTVQLVSVLPGTEKIRTKANLGGAGSRDTRHAISKDGSRVIFTSEENGHLYLRDSKAQETVLIDSVQAGASGKGQETPAFQTASADGSRIFFTDVQQLTADSKAGSTLGGQNKPDLYVFEVTGESPLSGTVTDLTPEGINGESADVQVSVQAGLGGGVLGASEDGTSVYFVANGALTENAPNGECSTAQVPSPNATCGLYMRHFNGTTSTWEAPKLVSVLADEDAGDWGGFSGAAGDLSWMTSRVSASGRYLAFMSKQSLTGYNNEDLTCTTEKAVKAVREACEKGERRDEEVFLYDANTERLTCVSCNPSGAQPAGVLDEGATGQGTGEGIGLVVDRKQIWSKIDSKADHWLAGNVPGWTTADVTRSVYQSRYLSDSGRLFFNSPDHIVPAATGAKEKVYEFEPNGVGHCSSTGGCIGLISAPHAEPGETEHEAAFLDASETGNDVFFLTAEKLVPQDVDTNFDVYDARVCTGESPCLTPPPAPPPPCGGETPCKGGAAGPPAFVVAASSSVPAGGNVASHGTLPSKVVAPPKKLTRAQLLAKALGECRKKYKGKSKKKKRVSCESHARKKYRAKKAAHKARKTSHSARRRA